MDNIISVRKSDYASLQNLLFYQRQSYYNLPKTSIIEESPLINTQNRSIRTTTPSKDKLFKNKEQINFSDINSFKSIDHFEPLKKNEKCSLPPILRNQSYNFLTTFNPNQIEIQKKNLRKFPKEVFVSNSKKKFFV